MDNITVIGIRKSRILINMLLGVAIVGCIIFSAVMWACYAVNSEFECWLNNGLEVEATITEVKYLETINNSTSSPTPSYDRRWVTIYTYISTNGTEYKGTAYVYRSNKPSDAEEIAKSKIGTTISVIIDPNSDNSRLGKLNDISVEYTKDLVVAIISCLPMLLTLYLLVYRGIFRSVLNYKIRKKVGVSTIEKVTEDSPKYINENIDKLLHPEVISQGEVTKVRKWIVCYVKVKYNDESGATREKWAQSWFTHKETKFLQEKKTITIVPYKNTYGILEKMQ